MGTYTNMEWEMGVSIFPWDGCLIDIPIEEREERERREKKKKKRREEKEKKEREIKRGIEKNNNKK